MKRLLSLSLVLVAFAAGCEATKPAAMSQPSNSAEMANWNNEITIVVNSAGQMWVGSWRIEDKNLADLVRERQVGRAKIMGEGEYKRALEVKKALQDAGVKNVEIVMPRGG